MIRFVKQVVENTPAMSTLKMGSYSKEGIDAKVAEITNEIPVENYFLER
jgi:hypothetical protein